MSREQVIVSGVQRWAACHPQKDVAVLVFGSGSYSPRQIAAEISCRSSAGLELLDLFKEAADDYSLEEVLSSLGAEFTGVRSHRP